MEKEALTKLITPFYKNIEVINCTGSTNDDLKKIALKEDEGYVLISDTQTGGKGRNGKSFFCSKGKGIYLSLLLKPKISLQKTLLISACAAVACVEAIKEVYNIETKIKWVNDIYIGDKKVAGILCESEIDNNNLAYLIVGIGINVHQTEFPEKLKDIATSIEEHTNKTMSREILIASFLNKFYEYYNNLEDSKLLELYRQYSNIIGKEITVYENKKTYTALAKDIDENGFLLVENECGKLVTLASGEITIRAQKNSL